MTWRRLERHRWRLPVLAVAATCGCGGDAASRTPSDFVGQWVWSARDSTLLQAVRRQRSTVPAAIWVATLVRRGDSLSVQLGRPVDRSVGADAELVIRIDDSFSSWWGLVPDDTLASWVGDRIARVLRLTDDAAHRRPVQLDYDAPVARLPQYAAMVRRLRRGEGGQLRGRSLWVTSLVAHLAHPDYGPLFRSIVDGQIVQLFDTGDPYSARAARQLATRLDRAGLLFRVGLGAVERRLVTGSTTHRAWFDFIDIASGSRLFRGIWIFPAGESYVAYLGG